MEEVKRRTEEVYSTAALASYLPVDRPKVKAILEPHKLKVPWVFTLSINSFTILNEESHPRELQIESPTHIHSCREFIHYVK